MIQKQILSLIHVQACMKLKAHASNMVLSNLWLILEPLLYVLLFYFVFKYMLNRGGEDFFIFLILGKIPFLWFQKSVISASNSIHEYKSLICQRNIPKVIFPMINIHEVLYKQVPAFVVMFIFLLSNGYNEIAVWWQIFPLLVVQYFLICGVSFIFAIIVTFANDFKLLIQMAMLGLMFSSGIFWDLNEISNPAVREALFHFNPLAVLLDSYRQVLMKGALLNWSNLIPMVIFVSVLFIISLVSINKLSNKLTQMLFR